MKKLMIAAAIVCAAVISQAASVQWNSGNTTDGFAGPNNESLRNITGYTYVTYFYSDAAGTTLLGKDESQTNAKPNGSIGATYSGYDFKNSTEEKTMTYYAKMVITSDNWTRETSIAAFDMPEANNANLNFFTGDGFQSKDNKWGAWQSVPEPTSGLLLLLGAAGLALRRRRA